MTADDERLRSARDAVSVLPDVYHDLFERAVEVCRSDDRVRALWLSGSLGRGTADAASDLDVIVTVADDRHPEFVEDWRAWLARITPTVLAEALPFAPGSCFSVTPRFARFDVVVESVSELPATLFRRRLVVFDRDGLTAMVPEEVPGPGPSATAVAGLVREFFRVSAVETILVRDDWLLAREHLHVLSSLLYRLFTESNAPLPAMGVKQWSARLTEPQAAAVASLATTVTSRADLAQAQQRAGAVFVPNAEVLCARLGVPWPTELEAAARRHLTLHLGLDDPYPRSTEIVV